MRSSQYTIKQHVVRLTMLIGLCLIFGAAYIVPLHNISAQEQNLANEVELTISPPVSYVHIKPGSSLAHTLTLENNSNQELIVNASAVDFISDGETGRPVLQNSHSFPYFTDESVFERPITLQPQQKAQLVLKFQVPQGATEKEYPLTILFKAQSASPGATTNPQITPAIGSNLIILVSYNDRLSQSLTVQDIQTTHLVDSFSPLKFDVLTANNSIHATAASGSATIVDWRGQTIASFDLYPDTILGSSTRLLRSLRWEESSKNSSSPPGAVQGPRPVPDDFMFKPNFLIGPYKITVTLFNTTPGNPGNQGEGASIQETSYSEVVFAFPLFLSLGILGVGVILGGSYWWRKKSQERANPFLT